VIWLALAATQWRLGQLLPEVAQHALTLIDDGSDLATWENARDRTRRATVLAKLRIQLESPPPKPRRPRRQADRSTDWLPGDVYEYRLTSGSKVFLRVLRLWPNNRRETSFDPCCDLVDWPVGGEPPTAELLQVLPPRQSSDPGLRADWFLLSQRKAPCPIDRIRLVARGLLMPTMRTQMGSFSWDAFETRLARDFGIE
jgi:hypothetical protein